LLDYVPEPYEGPVTLYAAETGLGPEGVRFWRPLAPAAEVVEVGGDHYTLLGRPHLERLAQEIARRLDAVSADHAEDPA
jgi:thioesterase domain-containing protein